MKILQENQFSETGKKKCEELITSIGFSMRI